MTHRLDLVDIVNELTRTTSHREHYTVRERGTWYGRNHITLVPSLIRQLQHASPSGTGEERTNSGFGSRPTARLEALDCLERIDRDADWWTRQLGHPRRGRDTTRLIQHLASLHTALAACDQRRPGCCTHHELEHDIRRWWTSARVVTGWDSPAWRPANTCPMCGTKGGLRVKLADQHALCVECRETWNPETIGLLADHIRSENADDLAAS